jgi:EF hand
MRLKLLAVSTAVLLLTTGSAFAGAGARVPEKSAGVPSSGRPSAVLDKEQCAELWSEAKGNAAPYIVNFKMVDKNGNGTISKREFKTGCNKGWVQGRASLPANSGGGQTPQHPIE